MKHFLVAGSHPALSWAEAKAVIGGARPEIAGDLAIFDISNWDGDVLQKRLAGAVKLGEIVVEMDIKDFNVGVLADQLEARPRANKITYGLTTFGGSSAAREKTKNLALQLKRELQERGRTVRWFAGEHGEVSPAAVAKAGLIDEGFDICIGLFGTRILIGLTTNVQDADAWSLRDYGRPFRDTEVGMLPPKLARLMVNLATTTPVILAEAGIQRAAPAPINSEFPFSLVLPHAGSPGLRRTSPEDDNKDDKVDINLNREAVQVRRNGLLSRRNGVEAIHESPLRPTGPWAFRRLAAARSASSVRRGRRC